MPDRSHAAVTVRRLAALAAFLLILIGGFQTFYLRIFTIDRAKLAAALADAQYRKSPGLRTFLIGVRERTPVNSRVALATPFTKWWGGYEYVYSRSLYHLTSRRVLPLVGPRDEVLDASSADFVAAWHTEPLIEGFEVVWRHPHGVLMKRRG